MDAVNLIWSAMNGEHLKYTEYNRITNMSTFRPVFADKMVYLLFRILVTGKRTVLVNQRGGLFQIWFVEFQNKWAFICLESQIKTSEDFGVEERNNIILVLKLLAGKNIGWF